MCKNEGNIVRMQLAMILVQWNSEVEMFIRQPLNISTQWGSYRVPGPVCAGVGDLSNIYNPVLFLVVMSKLSNFSYPIQSKVKG